MLSLPSSAFPELESQGLVASQVASELVASELVASESVALVLGSCIQELLENLPSQVLVLGGCQGLEFPALACHRYFQVGSAASWDLAGSPPRPSEEPSGPWALEVESAAHKGNTAGGSGSNRPPHR